MIIMKNALVKIASIVTTCLIGACQSIPEDHSLSFDVSKGDTLYICDAALINRDVVQTKLSDWITDFKIVRFEDSDSALIKGWRCYVSENYIGVADQSMAPFKLFNHQGEFLGCIGQIGQGPGEYTGIYEAAINEKGDRICLAASAGFLQEYDLKGNFIRKIGEYRLNKAAMHYEQDGSLTATHLIFSGMDNIQYLRVAKDGNVTLIPAIKSMEVACRDQNGSFIGYNNETWSRNNTSCLTYQISAFDTLYAFNPDTHETIPRFTLTNHPNAFCLYNETPSSFLISAYSSDDWTPVTNTIMVDKRQKRSYYLNITNDFVGNIPIPWLASDIKNGWYYEMFEPYRLLDLIDERLSDSKCSDKDRKALEELRNSIDEDGNNIMFLGKLKENIHLKL